MANYVTFAQLKSLLQEVGYKFKRLGSAYVTKGNITFANLPTPSANTAGFVYNVTDAFTTTQNFVEGAGNAYSAGTNVAIVDVTPVNYTAVASPVEGSTPKHEGWFEKDGDVYFLTSDATVNSNKTYYTGVPGNTAYKYDVIANFVDVDGIGNRITTVGDNLAPAFDETENYEIGDVVVYEDVLYKCKTAHTAGAWESNDFDEITIRDIVEAAEPDGLTTAQLNELIGLL